MARPKSRAESIRSTNEAYLGTKEAAAFLNVSVSTIQKMVEAGKLRAWRTQGGHRRIAEADVLAMNREGMLAIGAPGRRPLSVLVVEDNPTMVKSYTKVLAQWGPALECTVAGDAASALMLIAQKRPDLVVTDLAMEPFDGFHLIRTVRSSPELADTPVLVVTGMTEDDIAAKGGLDALTLCYRKPLSYERLGGYIDARLQDRQRLR